MGDMFWVFKIDTVEGRRLMRKITPQQEGIMRVSHEPVVCKFCGAIEAVRYGRTAAGKQRFVCRACRRTFLDNRAPVGMRFPTEAIAMALNMFYESASLSKIQRQLELCYGVKPDPSTIYRWIVRYSKRAVERLKDAPIQTGSTWVADETVVKLKEKGGSNHWFWDIIDSKSRFLLASHLSDTRTTKDANTLMERAAKRARKTPKRVITDKLAAYLDGVELAFGADTEHIPAKKLTASPGTQLIERFHGTLKDRTKVMRAMLRKGTAAIVTDGWLVHYNFFRPHMSLGGKTPAERAGVSGGVKSWKDVVQEEVIKDE